MLRIESVNQYYGESHILRDTVLEVSEGSCTCLMGRNGVGKSTLLKAIMGLIPIRSGEILFDKQSIGALPAHRRASLGIGYVPQGREIFPQLSVEENLRIGIGSAPIPERLFVLFPVLREMLQRRGGDLSGGQQQQLAFARALAIDPKLLILDEPTEGIQPNIVSQIGDVILKLNREDGLTVLLVEQKLPFAQRVSDHFTLLEKGATVASGETRELNETLIQQYLAV